MPNFQLDDEQFQAMISQQILSSISTESRDALVQEALKFLMAPQTDPFNRSRTPLPSPLAQAFREELVKVARRIAIDVLADEKIQAEVEKAVESFVRQSIENNGFDLAYVIGQAISQNLEVQFKS